MLMPRMAEATQHSLCSWSPWVLSLQSQPPPPCEAVYYHVDEFMPHVIRNCLSHQTKLLRGRSHDKYLGQEGWVVGREVGSDRHAPLQKRPRYPCFLKCSQSTAFSSQPMGDVRSLDQGHDAFLGADHVRCPGWPS